MANLIDDFQQGLVSRRKLLELLTGAAGSVVLASGQGKQTKAPEGIVEPPKLSPANIGGGGRIERDFYREWLKKSKVPMNALHRHFNSDPAHPARLLFITTFPFMIQVFGSMGLINDSNFSFNDRYDGAPDYFISTARVRQRWDKTNYVKDVRAAEVV